jgi:hypothetical protein
MPRRSAEINAPSLRQAGASPSLESDSRLHRHVHRRPARPGRIVQLVVAPARVEVSPPQIAEVIAFPRRSWKERDMSAEVIECFREAKHGKT